MELHMEVLFKTFRRLFKLYLVINSKWSVVTVAGTKCEVNIFISNFKYRFWLNKYNLCLMSFLICLFYDPLNQHVNQNPQIRTTFLLQVSPWVINLLKNTIFIKNHSIHVYEDESDWFHIYIYLTFACSLFNWLIASSHFLRLK